MQKKTGRQRLLGSWQYDQLFVKGFPRDCSAPARIHSTKALSSEKYFQPTIKWLIVFSLASSFCPSLLLCYAFYLLALKYFLQTLYNFFFLSPHTFHNSLFSSFAHSNFFLLHPVFFARSIPCTFILSYISYLSIKGETKDYIFMSSLLSFHLIAVLLYSQLFS